MNDQDQLPPHDLIAEQGVIGSIIDALTREDRQAIDFCLAECAKNISPEDFYDLRHRTIYDLVLRMRQNGERLDSVTFRMKMQKQGILESVGGSAYVDTLADFTPSYLNIAWYFHPLLEAANRRKIIKVGSAMVRKSFDGDDLSSLVMEARQLSTVHVAKRSEEEIQTGKEAGDRMINDLERRFNLQGKLSGLDTGFFKLNKITDGLQFAEQTLIGARPSMGKTALGVNILRKVCLENKTPVLFASLEMSTEAIMRRLLSDWANISMNTVRSGSYDQREFGKMTQFRIKCNESPLFIFDGTGGIDMGSLANKIRQFSTVNKIQLVVIDYMQKIVPSNRHEKRTYEVGEISQRLKALAVETGAAFLTLCQLNRESEKEKGRVPRLSDLADSGQIERDADTVLLIHRDKTDQNGATSLLVAKQRDGETGIVDLRFNGPFCRFENPPITP